MPSPRCATAFHSTQSLQPALLVFHPLSPHPHTQALSRRRAAMADDMLFPDEVDTPIEGPARLRFARYRGMKSFRHTAWDPHESLPPSYARIFTLPHFVRTQRRIVGELELAERALHSLDLAALQAERSDKRAARQAVRGKLLSLRHAAREPHAGSDAVSGAGGAMELDEGEADAAVTAAGAGAGAAAVVTHEDGDGDADLAGGAGERAAHAGRSVGASSIAAGGEGGAADLSRVLGPGWVASGQYVAITLANVPVQALQNAAPYGTWVPSPSAAACGCARCRSHGHATQASH